jgi:NADPH2:quinone reductase
MKAVLCKQFGPPESLVVEDLPSPKAGPGEAVVSVKAASLNFPDVLIIQNKYQFKPPLPFSPGSELSGVVKEVGEGVKGFKPGDRVISIAPYGAFAEEVKVDAGCRFPRGWISTARRRSCSPTAPRTTPCATAGS